MQRRTQTVAIRSRKDLGGDATAGDGQNARRLADAFGGAGQPEWCGRLELAPRTRPKRNGQCDIEPQKFGIRKVSPIRHASVDGKELGRTLTLRREHRTGRSTARSPGTKWT